jgi:hypothetical protein
MTEITEQVATEHAEATLTRIRGHLEAYPAGSLIAEFFGRDEMAAALRLLGEARATQAAAHRAVASYLGVDSPDLAADVRALVERCADAEAARDRLRHDLAAQGWQPLPADWHAQAEATIRLADALREVCVERDRLAEQVRRVRGLHRSVTTEAGLTPNSLPRCVCCKVTAPCDTVSVLGPDGGAS